MTGRSDGRPLIDRPARVVHVIPTIENGGAEQQLLALCRSMDRTHWENTVICTHGLGSLADEYAKANVRTVVIGKRRKGDILLAARLAKQIRQHEPDVVHGWLLQGNIWARLATIGFNPYSVFLAAERTTELEITPWLDFVDRYLSRVGDAVVGNSIAVSRYVTDRKRVPIEKVHTIWNGTDLLRAQKCLRWSEIQKNEQRLRRSIPDKAYVIVHIAQPIPCKRFDVLAEVVANLVKEGIDAHLLQLGRDPNTHEERNYLSQFRGWINAHNITDRVHRTGFVSDISAELAIADVVLHTSDIEGFPNAVIESLAMEKPVVATSAGGTSEVLRHRETGWLTDTGDVDALTKGVLHTYRHPNAAAAWAKNGRRLVEREFSVDSLVRNTTALYKSLLRHRGYEIPSD